MLALWLALMVLPTHADDPHAPGNLRFADVCRYAVNSGQLTCRDQSGNLLIDRARLYQIHLKEPYDELAVIALMRREGFDLGPRVDIKRDKNPILYFQKNGCGG